MRTLIAFVVPRRDGLHHIVVAEPLDEIARNLAQHGWAEVTRGGERCVVNGAAVAYLREVADAG